MQSRSHKIGCYDNSSLWNLRVISVARLSKCLSNFIASEKVQSRTSQLWDLTRPCGKASVCLVNRGPVDRRCMALKGGAQLDLASSCAVRRSTYTANGSPYVTKLCPITELYWNCNRQGGGGGGGGTEIRVRKRQWSSRLWRRQHIERHIFCEAGNSASY